MKAKKAVDEAAFSVYMETDFDLKNYKSIQ